MQTADARQERSNSHSLGTVPRSEAGAGHIARIQLRLRRSRILKEFEERLQASDDPCSEILPALCRAIESERLMDADMGFVVTENGEGVKLAFAEGFERSQVEQSLRLDFGQGIRGTIAATHQPMHVTNIQRSLDPMADLVRDAGINAYAGEPLIADGRLLGALSFASRNRSRFEAEDLLFFRAMAKLVASAGAHSTDSNKEFGDA